MQLLLDYFYIMHNFNYLNYLILTEKKYSALTLTKIYLQSLVVTYFYVTNGHV